MRLRYLRLIGIAGPLGFAVGLGLFTDRVLERSLPEHWAHAVATVIVAAGAIAFTAWIFGLLERIYGQLESQRESLTRLEERERIAMDLHDSIIQSIYGVSLSLEDAAGRLDESPQAARGQLDRAIDSLNRVIKDIRNYIFDLRPRVSQVADLRQALTTLVNELEVNTLMDVSLEVRGDLAALTEEETLSLYHIVQEALSNVGKHSKATSAAVRLSSDGGGLRLEVTDNGVGFNPGAEREVAKQGLRNIMDRARSLGAHLVVDSAPGEGTRIQVELPLVGARRQ